MKADKLQRKNYLVKRRTVARKILALVLVLCFILSFSACGGETASSANDTPNTSSSTDNSDVKIIIATTIDPHLSADRQQISDLKDTIGISVETRRYVSDKTIANEITAETAAGKAPDILHVNGYLPFALTVLQPLENSGINLKEFKNQSVLKAASINGKPYIAAGFDINFLQHDICVYNKELFETAGAETPGELYEKGEWTFDNFMFSARKIAALGDEYIGAGLLVSAPIAVSGESFFKLNNDKIEAYKAENLISVMKTLNQLYNEKVVKLDRSGFIEGRQGMALTDTGALARDGYFTGVHTKLEKFGFTFMPKLNKEDKYVISAPIRGFGIIKGTKNLTEAGKVIEALAALNAPTYENEEIYFSEEAEAFYRELCDKYTDNIYYYIPSDIEESTNIGKGLLYKWGQSQPEEYEGYLKGYESTIEQMAAAANGIVFSQ